MYREIARNRKPDGRYQPWFAHGQAHLNRRCPKPRRFNVDPHLRDVVAAKLQQRWSPQQVSRWLRRRWPRRTWWHVCAETIYEAVIEDGSLSPISKLFALAVPIVTNMAVVATVKER